MLLIVNLLHRCHLMVEIDRLYTRRRIVRLDKLGQRFVVRLVMVV